MEKKKKYLFPASSGMVAEVSVGIRFKGVLNRKIDKSSAMWEVLKETIVDVDRDCHVERMWVFFLNRRNMVMGYQLISQGSRHGTTADPLTIMQLAVHYQVSGVILVHNHPSGNLKPSTADLEMTRKINEGMKNVEVSVLDHMIYAPVYNEQGNVDSVNDFKFYSFADEGLI